MNKRNIFIGIAIICLFLTGISVTVSANQERTEEKYQTVKVIKGDSLWKIAQKYKTTIAELVRINNIENPDHINVGILIKVPLPTYNLNRGVHLSSREANKNTSRGAVSRNRIYSTESIRMEEKLENISLVHPVASARLSSKYGPRWGRMHWGIDLACPTGTPVLSAAAGRVSYAGWRSGYGWLVEIDHGSYKTRYAHNSKVLVSNDEVIGQGQLIAKVGATGRTTGAHLHFELIIEGKKVNPLDYL